MKLLHTSDWHLGKLLNEYSLLEDQRVILGQIVEIARSQQVDAVLISGDLFDRSVAPAQAVSLLDETLYTLTSQLSIPVLAIGGNHDGQKRLSFLSRLCRGSGLYLQGEYEPDTPPVTLRDDFGEVQFFLMPYAYPAQIRSCHTQCQGKTFQETFAYALDQLKKYWDPHARHVLLAHGFFARAENLQEVLLGESELSVGPADLIDSSLCADFDYAALGHLHRAQRAGEEHIRYSGAPLAYAVGETGEKSVTLVTLGAPGDCRIERIPLTPLRRVRTITGEFDELLCIAEDSPLRGDYVFAQLTQDAVIPDAMARLRTVYPYILGMKLLPREQEAAASLNFCRDTLSRDPRKLFEEFYEALKGVPMTQTRAELSRGLFERLLNSQEDC